MGLFDLLDDDEDVAEGSVIDSIIREATQGDPGEIGVMPVSQEEDDFFRQLREGKFDTPAHPTHPDESGTGSVETPAKKKSKGKRVAYSVACTLNLSGSDYQVQPLPPSSDYDRAYRLNKIGAQKPTGYNVTQIDGEILCECADFKFRQDGTDGKGCKHIRGLVDMGFFYAPPTSYRQGSGIFDG